VFQPVSGLVGLVGDFLISFEDSLVTAESGLCLGQDKWSSRHAFNAAERLFHEETLCSWIFRETAQCAIIAPLFAFKNAGVFSCVNKKIVGEFARE
jgi:hypothetical protein